MLNYKKLYITFFLLSLFVVSCSKEELEGIPEDVKLVFEDDFNGSKTNLGTGTFLNGTANSSLKDGKYVIRISNYISNQFFYPNIILAENPKKYIFETSAKINHGSGAIFLCLGAKTAGPNQPIDYIGVYLSLKDTFTVYRAKNNQNEILANWQINKAIDISKHAKFQAVLENNTLKLFVNGSEIYSLNNPGINTLEAISLGAAQWENMGSTVTEVEYDYVRMYASN